MLQGRTIQPVGVSAASPLKSKHGTSEAVRVTEVLGKVEMENNEETKAGGALQTNGGARELVQGCITIGWRGTSKEMRQIGVQGDGRHTEGDG